MPTTRCGKCDVDPGGALTPKTPPTVDSASEPDSIAGPSPAHLYAAPGTYTVTLTVSDELVCSTTFILTGQTAYCGGGPAARGAQQVVVPREDTTRPRSAPSPQPGGVRGGQVGPERRAKPVGTNVKYRVSEAGVTTFTVECPTRGVRRASKCVKRAGARPARAGAVRATCACAAS
jgi:PKD domain-containing protein